MNESITHMHESGHTYEWVMSRTWKSRVTHMNESCHAYEHIARPVLARDMSFVTHLNESYHTHEWVVWHTWMSHVPHTNESCPTYKWVMHGVCARESQDKREQSVCWQVLCVTWLIHVGGTTHSPIHVCGRTRSYVSHDACVCVTVYARARAQTNESKAVVTWLIHVYDMNHSYVWHDCFVRVTWLMHVCHRVRASESPDKREQSSCCRASCFPSPLVSSLMCVCVCVRIY